MHCGFLTLCKLGSSGLGGKRAGDHACLPLFTDYGIMKVTENASARCTLQITSLGAGAMLYWLGAFTDFVERT